MSIRKYVDIDAPEEFLRLYTLVLMILTNEEDCFLRQFSIRCFHDSKAAEKEIKRAVNVTSEFSEKDKYLNLSEEEILAEHNIYRNPSWMMMKGKVK